MGNITGRNPENAISIHIRRRAAVVMTRSDIETGIPDSIEACAQDSMGVRVGVEGTGAEIQAGIFSNRGR